MPYILLLNVVLWTPTLFTKSDWIDVSRWLAIALAFTLSTALMYAVYLVGRKALKFTKSLLKRIPRGR